MSWQTSRPDWSSWKARKLQIALFRVDGALYALSDTCTHRGGPLSEGAEEGTEVTCLARGAEAVLRQWRRGGAETR
jgi:nitrite reductase/ring-hydroxylating ferredoxin subunit